MDVILGHLGLHTVGHCYFHKAVAIINFSSCQQNLIKTFQIEAMTALITKMAMVFSSGQKKLSKKDKNFRNFRNKSCSIFMLHKINRKKSAPKLIFLKENIF